MYYFIVHFKHFELIFEMVELEERVVMIECIDTILKDDDNGELCIFLIFESLMSENCLNNKKYSQYFQFILDYFYKLKTKEENQEFFTSINIVEKRTTNKIILTIKIIWRFLSLNFIKLLSINVKNVKKPSDNVIINIDTIKKFFLINLSIMR